MSWTEFVAIVTVPIATLVIFIEYLLYAQIQRLVAQLQKFQVEVAAHYTPTKRLDDFRTELLSRLDKISDNLDKLNERFYRLRKSATQE